MRKLILLSILSFFTFTILNAQTLTYFGPDASTGTNVGQSGSQCSFFGYNAGLSNTTGSQNAFVGGNAGQNNTIGAYNSFMGVRAGRLNTTGPRNSFFGCNAGQNNTTGKNNSFMGMNAGSSNTTGSANAFVGANTGIVNTTGSGNSFIGSGAGAKSTTGSFNTYVGISSGGSNSVGDKNVFLGYLAGSLELGSDKLYIENSISATPLIYGDFANDELTFNGTVSIATPNMPPMTASDGSPYRLYVNGGVLTKEVKVELGWADNVFEEDYCRTTLEEENQFIEKNGHLKGFESAKVMNGKINLGDVTLRQQVKIEEMRLDQIDSHQTIQAQAQQIETLTELLQTLNKRVVQLEQSK